MFNNRVQIIGCATVIEPQLPVHFSAASAIVPGEYIKAVLKENPGHPFYVGTVCVALQSV